METPRVLRKKEYINTARKVESMLREFLDDTNVEHTMEQSESGWVYVIHLLPDRQGDVRIRLYDWKSERGTRIFSVPMRLPECVYKEHEQLLRLCAIPYNEFNGKLTILGSADNIRESVLGAFERTLYVLSDIIEKNKQKSA